VKYDPQKHHRRSIRLQGYDYSRPGAYFLTICTHNRKCLFGKIVDGEMVLNDAGQMIVTVWNEIPQYYPGVGVDVFQIMPNHIHGIIIIVGAGPRACPDMGQPRGMGQPLEQGTKGIPEVQRPFMVTKLSPMPVAWP